MLLKVVHVSLNPNSPIQSSPKARSRTCEGSWGFTYHSMRSITISCKTLPIYESSTNVLCHLKKHANLAPWQIYGFSSDVKTAFQGQVSCTKESTPMLVVKVGPSEDTWSDAWDVFRCVLFHNHGQRATHDNLINKKVRVQPLSVNPNTPMSKSHLSQDCYYCCYFVWSGDWA